MLDCVAPLTLADLIEAIVRNEDTIAVSAEMLRELLIDDQTAPCERCSHAYMFHRKDEPSSRCMKPECRCQDYDPPFPRP